MHKIITMLAKGDLRQKGCSEEVVELVRKDNALFSVLIGGIQHESPGVRMRASDATEKLTRDLPELLQPYKRTLLMCASTIEQQEVRWHLAQILPRMNLTRKERSDLYKTMLTYLDNKSRIVVTFAMQALADIAQQDNNYLPEVLAIIKKLNKQGTPAMRSRSKKLLAQLDKK